MMQASLEGTFAALADSTRMAVVRLLSQEPRRAGELAEALEMTPAAMSRHLRALRKSGLVGEEGIEEDARVRIYRLRQEPFEQMREWLQEVERFWDGQLASFKSHVEQRRKRMR